MRLINASEILSLFVESVCKAVGDEDEEWVWLRMAMVCRIVARFPPKIEPPVRPLRNTCEIRRIANISLRTAREMKETREEPIEIFKCRC